MSSLTFTFVLGLVLLLRAEEGYSQGRTSKKDVELHDTALNFVVVGDWGRRGTKRQREVAARMDVVCRKAGVDFIISTGDNFYPNGVLSETDDAWQYSFEQVYNGTSLQIPWYPVLGNHDYGGDPDAQVRYSMNSSRWKMPARYYHQTFSIPGDSTEKLAVVFIDTSPLVRHYYGRPSMKLVATDSTDQLRWIKKVLSSETSNVRWKLVVGHHPIYTVGERRNNDETKDIRRLLKPVFVKGGVTAYISGHEHNLQHLIVSGVEQFVSGAGSETRLILPFVKKRFGRSSLGFMLFSIMPEKMIVQVINRKGKVIYRYTKIGSSN
jgi:tartrate-resistant acid phosphatase type 5